MTRLDSITKNHLALTCSLCGHTSMVAVKYLIDTVGRETDVQEVVPKLRCSKCHVKGQATFVITYVGGSGEALLGAKQGD
ncbi:hypothetical protein [Roseivivax sp. CAU 1753]